MAVATSLIAQDRSSLKRALVTFTFSGTYTTGGEASSAGFKKDLQMSKIHMVIFDGYALAGADTGLVARYDYAADKILLARADQVDDFLEQLPNGTAITHTIRAEVIGEGNS